MEKSDQQMQVKVGRMVERQAEIDERLEAIRVLKEREREIKQE